jgi:hypothetical protein
MGGKYSDLTITCNNKQWAVHKAVICSRSSFFDLACSRHFRESKTGIIDLPGDDEDAVGEMIYYLYHLDYLNDRPISHPSAMFRHRAYADARRRAIPKVDFTKIEDPLLAQAGFSNHSTTVDDDSSPSPHQLGKTPQSPHSSHDSDDASDGEEYDDEYDSTESESHLFLHAQVYALAEKYDIPSLKQLARQKFEVATACYYDAPELTDAIRYVFSSTVDSDRGLRGVVVQLFKRHPQLATTPDMNAVIRETPSLALDLFKIERGLL